MLADEPTAALNPSAKAQVYAALLTAAAEPGQALVTVLHDLHLLPTLATCGLVIAQGCVQWDLPMHAVDDGLLQVLYAGRPDPDAPAESAAPAVAARSSPSRQCVGRTA